MTLVVLTRSQFENDAFKRDLSSYNFTFIDLPLIEYENLELNEEAVADFNNIIITSKYAAKILALRSMYFKPGVRFWVVGELSADILRTARLNVKYQACDVKDLMSAIPQEIYVDCLYLSANEITSDLPDEIHRQIIYNVKYKHQLTDIQIESLNKGVDYILLYSVNAAKTFAKLMIDNDVQLKLQNATVISISADVAKVILPYFKKIIYCQRGKHTKMIELLISHAETS